MFETWKVELEEILTDLAEEIAISPSKYEDAVKRYEAVGKWLGQSGSPLENSNPIVYAQGSFALGTAVRPIGENDLEYDIDAVCKLSLNKNETTQRKLKNLVGDRLKENQTYLRMLEAEGRRCWTLNYSDESRFHMDILPAIPNPNWKIIGSTISDDVGRESLCITNKDSTSDQDPWPTSNPKAYTEWFKSRMKTSLAKSDTALARNRQAEIHAIPDYEFRTPLQKYVQILKRHRDIRFVGDDNRPSSIIITTLAALAYQNEDTIVDTLLNTVTGMRRFIENRGGVYWVGNPVDPTENFADKWKNTPKKKDVFFQWLDELEALNKKLLDEKNAEEFESFLGSAYGERDTSAALNRRTNRLSKSHPTTYSSINLPSIFNVSYRQKPSWPNIASQEQLTIRAKYMDTFGRWTTVSNNGGAVPKRVPIIFQTTTSVKPPYQVFWQVTNTGPEANDNNKRRGNIFPAKTLGVGGLSQKENTLYSGKHCMQCYLVKDGTCVAKSDEFAVNIE